MRKKITIAVVIILILLSGIFLWRRGKKESSPLTDLSTVRVQRGEINLKVLSTGTLRPYTRVELRSPVRGRVDEVKVEEGARVKAGDILAWLSSEDRVALLDAARSGMEEASRKNDAEAVRQATEEMEIARRAYAPVPLTAPIEGEVIKRSLEPGQSVFPDNTLFVLSDRLVAGVEVDEADIGRIRVGQRAVIILDAFPLSKVRGRVAKISREGRDVSNVIVYDVLVEPAKIRSRWAAGMTANVEFLIAQKKDILLIPIEVIKERKGKKFVMVTTAGTPRRQEIETGLSDGRMVEVTSGLTEGERILIAGREGEKPQPRRRPRMRLF